MNRVLFGLCLLLIVHTSLSGQFKDISRPDADDRFLVYISPMSTAEYIDTVLNVLEGNGIKITINRLVYTTDGQLKSFFARIVPECADEGFVYEGTTDFSHKNHFPIAGLFIGEDCSSGVFTIPYENATTMYSVFFPTKDPAHLLYGWKGDFEAVKDVTLAVNFTLPTTEEHE